MATSAFAATALAAPNAQFWAHPGRPQFWRPAPPAASSPVATTVSGDEDCLAPTTTTTAYVTITEKSEATLSATSTSSTTVVTNPNGGSSTSTIVILSTPSSSVVADPTCAASIATIIATYTSVVSASPVTVTVIETARVANTSAVATSISTPLPKCITSQESEELAEVFRLLIQDYSTGLALAALTEDFVDYSSSVNILMNKGAQYPKNITGPTFATRAMFMSGQGSQPKIPFERLNTFYGCDSVSVRWMSTRSGNGQKTEAAMVPVIGNGLMHVVPSTEAVQTYNGVTYNWRVKELYSEFNAAAWLINLGIFVPPGPVDYINAANATNATAKRSVDDYEHFDASFRGAAI
ncbi:hypothetical protein LTR62_006201 [Meristemomyces frigidus]|uniref:NTF2-like domain-containing protein n=1 Tax=Meristemomyces frigidus TaxID=1508187 RepID=A0AAN7TCQ0_9PEZI|nr:hypothetical protein LTR62_006201 [Meristemomyces frigidus]